MLRQTKEQVHVAFLLLLQIQTSYPQLSAPVQDSVRHSRAQGCTLTRITYTLTGQFYLLAGLHSIQLGNKQGGDRWYLSWCININPVAALNILYCLYYYTATPTSSLCTHRRSRSSTDTGSASKESGARQVTSGWPLPIIHWSNLPSVWGSEIFTHQAYSPWLFGP